MKWKMRTPNEKKLFFMRGAMWVCLAISLAYCVLAGLHDGEWIDPMELQDMSVLICCIVGLQMAMMSAVFLITANRLQKQMEEGNESE